MFRLATPHTDGVSGNRHGADAYERQVVSAGDNGFCPLRPFCPKQKKTGAEICPRK